MRQALVFAQLYHRVDVVWAYFVRIDDFDAGRQRDSLGFRHGMNVLGFPQEHAMCDAALVTDGGGANGAGLVAFRQDDALGGVARALGQLVTESGG